MNIKSLIKLLLMIQIVALYVAIYMLAGALGLGLAMLSLSLFYALFTLERRSPINMDMVFAKAIADWYFAYMRKIKHPKSVFATNI